MILKTNIVDKYFLLEKGGKYHSVELLGYMESVGLIWGELAKFSKAVIPFCIM